MYNAQSETVHEKRTFKKAFESRRCLIPAGGYYEKKPKQERILFKLPDHDLFCFAGIWEEWKREPPVRSFTMLTTEPNGFVTRYHNRMPVILARDAYADYLNPKATYADLRPLFVPWAGEMTAAESPKPTTGKPAAPKGEKPVKPKPGKGKKDETGGLFG
jgi:putative SOS response-associated peptidase YedK